MLAQPITEFLRGHRRILLAGAGGGYDLLGAVPLVHELRARGAEVHLASLSFAYLNGLDGARRDPELGERGPLTTADDIPLDRSTRSWRVTNAA